MLDYVRTRSAVPQVASRPRSPSRCSTPSASASCCPSRTTRSCTASARCSSKMPGDVWQKHATLRDAASATCSRIPGKKLLFMGAEIGQWREWNHDGELDWPVLGDPRHEGLQRWVRDLNHVYRDGRAAVGRRLRARGLRLDRLPRPRQQHRLAPAPRPGDRPASMAAVANFTPTPRTRLPDWRAATGPLAGAPEQRRRASTAAATPATPASRDRAPSRATAIRSRCR